MAVERAEEDLIMHDVQFADGTFALNLEGCTWRDPPAAQPIQMKRPLPKRPRATPQKVQLPKLPQRIEHR
jgi:hypothetical protein